MHNKEILSLWILGTIIQICILLFLIKLCLDKDPTKKFLSASFLFGFFTAEFVSPFYTLITGIYPDYDDYMDYGSISVGVFFSGIYWIFFLYFWTSNKGEYLTEKVARYLNNYVSEKNVHLFVLIFLALSYIGYFTLDSTAIDAGFSAASESIKSVGGSIEIGAGLLNPFGSLAFPIVAVVMYETDINRINGSLYGIYLRWITIFFIIFAVIFGVTMGSRAVILNILMVYIAGFLLNQRYKIALIQVFTVIFLASLASPFIQAYKFDPSLYVGKTTIERLQILVGSGSYLSSRDSTQSNIEDLIFRFDGVQNGGHLILNTSSIGNAPFWPYASSVVSVIPRYFWASKPVPKSADGTPETMPQSISGTISGRQYLTTSISTSGIAYWHFGLLGLILVPFLMARLTIFLQKISITYHRVDIFLFLYFFLRPNGLLLEAFFSTCQFIIPILIIMRILSPSYKNVRF